MTKKELIKELERNNVDKSLYDFENGHGFFDDQFLLNKESNTYIIYYLERGKKNKIKSFSSEEKANNYFLELLLNYKD